MTNQGANMDANSSLASNSPEKFQAVHKSEGHGYMSSTSGSEATPWAMQKSDNCFVENEILSDPQYQYDQPAVSNLTNFQEGSNITTFSGLPSNSGEATVSQEYNGHASYHGSVPYGYENTGYSGYYNYPQPSNQSYQQPVGAYQNTGAPYQPISSFQNTGSYVDPASYSSTYYNPTDYQTSGAYQSNSAYSDQTNLWSENFTNYTPYQYSNYTSDSNGVYISNSTTATSQQYQEEYKQWADYYSQTEVSCAPGTENLPVASAPALPFSTPAVTGGYLPSSTQQPQTYNPSWKPDLVSSQFPSLQGSTATNGVYNGYKNQEVVGFPNNYVSHLQPHSQNPLDLKLKCDSFQDQQVTPCLQIPFSQGAASHQVSACPQSPFSQSAAAHPVTQDYQFPLHTTTSLDTHRVSTMQIPTNPRISSNFPSGLPKNDKGGCTLSSAAKPAYISVSLPKANDNVLSHDATDSMFKPAVFPPSLRGYVERALARCKDDVQMTACQTVMKEIITSATANGTLCTRDWDTEPLFPLPNSNKFSDSLYSSPVSSLLKCKRSPSRRTKSRWEPLVDEKITDKATLVHHDTANHGIWPQYNGFSVRDSNTKVFASNNTKLISSDQSISNKNIQRPEKMPRVSADVNVDLDASSDSDKEQNLIAYSSAATAFANSPEERKKRECRSKRFEKGRGCQGRWGPHIIPKNGGAGDLYARRACASVINTSFENGSGRAVEDIDWDSLTVKGTSQEIEKCYLRLTSAPDPSTVRPEEVLEKALRMVQTSQKNYLYKCDQLKSIRQDLTVQRINNELTVKVYETHARLALENGDFPEYNQCQSQLKPLYADGIRGCDLEFYAYNLLRVIMHSTNNRDVLSSMSRLSEEAKKDSGVKHALAVRAAFTSGNYVKFFRLYKTAPNLNACLMDVYVEKMRYSGVKCMCRSYRPTVPITYVARSLGFTSSGVEEDGGLEECVEWLKLHGACLITHPQTLAEMQLDAKASCSSLYMPEAEDAVAHGDASLAVNDFLARTS